jgi:thioredoxin reductase (NADPH)
MAKPALLAVDDEPEVLRSVERDLRRKYGQQFRILRAESGASALDAAERLKSRTETVALFLADQRMPVMSGVEFLAAASKVFPSAKKVLLTAYADTNAAIAAINQVRLDYYLLKPWDPPESNLYPILDDLLDDWRAQYRPPFGGLRVVGYRWSQESHAVKDFLGRNSFPYEWIDLTGRDGDPDLQPLLNNELKDASSFPVVIFPDGARVERPTTALLAERLGLQTSPGKKFYDLLIVGGGPAGLAAAVYGASEGLKTALVESEAPGGQAGMSSRIENYLGFPSGLTGGDLARRAMTQAKRFGVEILCPQSAIGVKLEDPYRILKLADGSEISCHALLIATGLAWRKLDVPGVDRFTGTGVYYGAALTEAISCRDEEVVIVGGANSAGQGAIHFAQYAKKVIMLVRAAALESSMSQYLVEQIKATPNITVLTNTEVIAALGQDHLECVQIRNNVTGEAQTLTASAMFIFIGAKPRTKWLADLLSLDDHGFIYTGNEIPRPDGAKVPKGWKLDRLPFLLETNVPGIFAAGDVRHSSIKRVASAVGAGSICVQMIHQHLALLSGLANRQAAAAQV